MYILSNFIRETFQFVSNKYEFFSLFDGKILSFQEGCIKPEKKIYKILLSRFQLSPKNCLFLDDTESCVVAAKKLGIRSILIKENTNLKKQLKKFNIKLS
ncbi:MAG: HAD-IA family hydrolase [Candidatus Lokiarchaeota archaeon]|nr:HAD-IA family hydrolase [Candidatus Lokiarchaeota archaeon]MBD3338287.1 HAD-IA family hydrolase [Candidatus Lokiarchaeota archaeon]